MNNMANETVGSMVLRNLSKEVHGMLKSINDGIVDMLVRPKETLEWGYNETKESIISAIQTKINFLSSQQISDFRNQHIDIPEEELNRIILTHQLFYSVLYKFISSIITLQIFELSVDQFEAMIENIVQKELEKINLDISIEEFEKIIGNMINHIFLNKLSTYLLTEMPNIIVKLLISFFPLINTPTVLLNIVENQLAGFTILFTGVTLEVSRMLIEKRRPHQSTEEEKGEEKGEEEKGKEEKGKEEKDKEEEKGKEEKKGGKRKFSSKKMNKYSKKYYINRIRKTLKSFYRR
jgi:hypothetical protein